MVLTPEQQRYVTGARVARLSTADEGGRPHAVPVCFAYEGGVFYTAIDRKPKSSPPSRLRRLANIAANPRAALLVDHYSDDWSELSYVLVSASALLVECEAERERAVGCLREKYPQYRTMLADDAIIIRLTPGHASAWSASGSL